MNIDKIKNNAKFVLDDADYKKLISYLEQNKVDASRILIDELIDKTSLELICSSDNEKEQLLKEINLLGQIESEIFNLYEDEDEREQIKHVIE